MNHFEIGNYDIDLQTNGVLTIMKITDNEMLIINDIEEAKLIAGAIIKMHEEYHDNN